MHGDDTTFEGANSSLVTTHAYDDKSFSLSPKRLHPHRSSEGSADDVTRPNNTTTVDGDAQNVRFSVSSPSSSARNQHLRTDGSDEDMRQSMREAALAKHGVFGHAFGEAHDQLDHFFENSMLDLRRREIEI